MMDELRKRAKVYLCRNQYHSEDYEALDLIRDLLQALDDAGREEGKRCEKVVEEQIGIVSSYMYYIDRKAGEVLKERIFAAIREKGEK